MGHRLRLPENVRRRVCTPIYISILTWNFTWGFGFLYLLPVSLASNLNQEVSRIHLEHARQTGFLSIKNGHCLLSIPTETPDERNLQSTIVHIQTVYRITVTARAGVDTNIFSFLCGEAGKDTVIQFDKRFEHITSSPRVSRVISQSETA